MAPPPSTPPRTPVKRGWIAALASAVVPGLGQLYAGHTQRARRLFVVDAFVLGSVLVALVWFRLEVLKLWVIPAALTVIVVVNLALGLFRGLAAANAYLAIPSDGRPTPMGVIGLTSAALVIVVPHLLVGYLAVTQYDVIETVFPDPVPVAVTETTVLPSSPATTPSATSVPTVPSATTLPPSTTTPSPPIWDGLERLNIVLLGADAGVGRTGVRTDTIIVVSIAPQHGDTVMISVPRDLSNAPLPDGMGRWSCNCYPDLITHLYDAGVRYPDAFPGPGDPPIDAIKAALTEILGVPIHYYAMVTLDGFVGVVDALGGVTIDVPKTIVDNTYPHEDGTVERMVIEQGIQHLDGHHALAYARIRRGSSDFARMHRQRCVLGAAVSQASPLEIIAGFGRLATAVKEHVSTDIPQDRLVDFVDLIPRISTDRIAALRITRTEYQTGGAPGRVYYDIERIRADAQALIADPEAAQATLDLVPLDGACEVSYD